MAEKYNINDLRRVMKKLLGKNGCTWDKAQTHQSLKKYFIEETYEVIEAINNNNSENLCEELGDVLFQIVFHSELAEKENLFLFDNVVDGITKKMIMRHPHVFSKSIEKTAEYTNSNWDSIKKQEKGYKSNIEIVKSVPKALPALIRSEKTISKAEKTNLDTLNLENLIKENHILSSKLESTKSMNNLEKMEYIGSFLLNLSKISYFLQINAEFSLTNALETYINKLEDIETANATVGGTFEDTDSEGAKVKKIKGGNFNEQIRISNKNG